MSEPKIINHKYEVVAEPALLLIGTDLDTAEDVNGWDINLVKWELWSDGDKVICHKQTITSTTEEKEIKYLKNIVKCTSYFTIAWERDIPHYEAYKLFL